MNEMLQGSVEGIFRGGDRAVKQDGETVRLHSAQSICYCKEEPTRAGEFKRTSLNQSQSKMLATFGCVGECIEDH